MTDNRAYLQVPLPFDCPTTELEFVFAVHELQKIFEGTKDDWSREKGAHALGICADSFNLSLKERSE